MKWPATTRASWAIRPAPAAINSALRSIVVSLPLSRAQLLALCQSREVAKRRNRS